MQIERLFPFAKSIDVRTSELLCAVMEAHVCSATNNPNASTAAAVNSYCGSRSINQAICSAILATGQVHGPVTDARLLLEQVCEGKDPSDMVDVYLSNGLKVPGFGNSFFKQEIDPCWLSVADFLIVEYPQVTDSIQKLQAALSAKGLELQPNAAMFTGAAAMLAGFPIGTEPAMFIVPRIGAWVQASIK